MLVRVTMRVLVVRGQWLVGRGRWQKVIGEWQGTDSEQQAASMQHAGISKLLHMVYETDNGDSELGDPVEMPVMWRYRLQVNFITAKQRLAYLRCRHDAGQGEVAQHVLLYYFMQHVSDWE